MVLSVVGPTHACKNGAIHRYGTDRRSIRAADEVGRNIGGICCNEVFVDLFLLCELFYRPSVLRTGMHAVWGVVTLETKAAFSRGLVYVCTRLDLQARQNLVA